MIETVKVDWIMGFKPCRDYPEERVRELLGDGIPRADLLRLSIPAEDRVWVATRDGFLSPDELQAWLDIVSARAIRLSFGRSGIPSWESWATRWLSGCGRSRVAADAVADEAEAVADEAACVAWSSARSAALDAAARSAAWDTALWAANAALWAARSARSAAWDTALASARAALSSARSAEALASARAALSSARAAEAEEREAQVADLLAILAR